MSSAIGLKVFSATKARDREGLGEAITAWLGEHPELEVFEKVVTQSSDAEFHCFTITLFYRTAQPPERAVRGPSLNDVPPRDRADAKIIRLSIETSAVPCIEARRRLA